MSSPNSPETPCHSCEICGLEGLTDTQFRDHTLHLHLDGTAICPFCQMGAASDAELIIHVNTAHLDYLTPDSDTPIGFIDDNSPQCSANGWDKPHVKNINVAPKGGSVGAHAQGSPRRSDLALQLRNNETLLQCPMCPFTSQSPSLLEEHVNRRHFDLTSPSVNGGATESTKKTDDYFGCPLCNRKFTSAPDLELHVNIEHKDVLSPASPGKHSCPVCGVDLDEETNSEAAARHVESHFLPSSIPSSSSCHVDRERERREFEQLQAQYGMDNQGNFREQFVTNMQRAVYAGELSVSDYYERTLDLRMAESCGIDDGSSVTRSITPRLRAVCANSRTLLCTSVDHYASSYGDRGWGCGYRNAQMLISSLLSHTGYNDRLYKIWEGEKPPRSSVPSISRLQHLIEQAWAHGFDLQGSEQLGSRLVNTRKWIGATEVVTLLSFLRIKCLLVDFHKPTGRDGTHPELFEWVLNYFENGGDFVAPLYLQHQGHSRTIVGIEVQRNRNLVLLVMDPSHSPQQMAQLGSGENGGGAALRLLRKTESAMKARQYQIVAVTGMLESEEQYQQSKLLRGMRIPKDR